jgi:metallo-beta-lactamase family protein
MKITFLGAAQTVTGSCFMLEAGGRRFAVDCGMHQGPGELERRNLKHEPYRPREIDFFLITHAHIDHSGLLPKMVKEGFRNPIYCTRPTRDLLEIMLLDSAYIQEMEAEWQSRKLSRHGERPVEALYTREHAERTCELLVQVEYEEPFEPFPGLKVNYREAGHILGSAFVELTTEEEGGQLKTVFSGDLGRPNQLLVRDPGTVEHADHLVIESTYGDRDHKDEGASRDELAQAIAYSYERGEKVIIPAFAVERTQEVLYSLSLLEAEGRLPRDMPVYLDSPLAIRATEIFRKHAAYLDEDTNTLIANGRHPLELKNLRMTQRRDDSRAINTTPGPAVVISASGMCTAGRIKHHLRHNLWRPGASVVFVGFQAKGTPGRKIVDGAKRITLLGETVAVKAKVFTIGGFSAHAGQSQILDWIGAIGNSRLVVHLVHGEASAQEALAAKIKERFGYTVHVPMYLEETVLEHGKAPVHAVDMAKAKPAVDWAFLLGQTEGALAELRQRMAAASARPWIEQVELRDRILEVNRSLLALTSEM